jgi:hypothetical protein
MAKLAALYGYRWMHAKCFKSSRRSLSKCCAEYTISRGEHGTMAFAPCLKLFA